MSERDTIIQQFVKFSMLHTEIPEINNYLYPKARSKTIGEKTSKFTISNYIGRYNDTLESKNYQILFYDESLISFFYEFLMKMEMSLDVACLLYHRWTVKLTFLIIKWMRS